MNAYEAVSSQLHRQDIRLAEWRKLMPESTWDKLKVVIVNGHMPRQEHSCFQLFSKLLAEKKEGDRIVYTARDQRKRKMP